MRTWRGPKLPRHLLHTMYEMHTEGGGYDKHGPVHSLKRYMVEKKGESNPK